ncbi:hypothetical protein D3C77_272360 [compost metagenome]
MFVDLLQCVQVVTPEPGIALGFFQAVALQSFICGGRGYLKYPIACGFVGFDVLGVTR